MAQPTPYAPTYDFSDWQAVHPTDPLPGADLDVQLNLIKTFTQQVCTNLAIIQRDDGALANLSVGVDQLKPEVSIGFNSVTNWVTGHAYVARDGVYQGNNVYICSIAHTSDTFATDLAAGKWLLVVNLNQFLAPAAASAASAAASAVLTSADRVQTGIDAATSTAASAAAQAAASGMKWRPSVRLSTVAALPSNTYANGASGVGATLTATANGALSIDSVAVVAGDRVLIKDEVSTLKNGVYTVTQAGTGGTPYILTRATDADTWTELLSQVVAVEEGTAQPDYTFICTVNSGGTIGSTAVTWSSFRAIPTAGSVTGASLAAGGMTSAQLAAALTDEVGSGSVLFNVSPAFYFSATVIGNAGAAGFFRMYEDSNNGTNYTDFIAASNQAANYAITMPAATGTMALTSDIAPKGSQLFTTGSGNFTAPADATPTTRYKFTLTGGGGGTGGVSTGTSGGGGAGATAIYYATGLTASSTHAYSIGAAGTAGAATPTSGGNGGNSTVNVAGTLITAPGGNGSISSSGGATPAGGAVPSACTNAFMDLRGGAGASSDSAGPGGNGAASFWGGGGRGQYNAAGEAAVSYGAGGGGTHNGGAVVGSAGGSGCLLVEWG